MDANVLKEVFLNINEVILENKDYLIELDQQNGDGDLGISMSSGFNAVVKCLSNENESDLGKLFMIASSAFNEAAPSSLGTIISVLFMGIAKKLKGKDEATLCDIADAMEAGVNMIMEKADSKPGEKTILDSLCPAIGVLNKNCKGDVKTVFEMAYGAAKAGSESTKMMKSVHGRAAYYGESSIGILDGGSVVGKLIFEGIYRYCCQQGRM